jgi:heme oxygenase
MLRRFYGYYRPVEARLATIPWASLGFAWSARRKTPLLERDLLAIGETEMDTLPRCHDLPPLDAVPKALGCLYVLEGATLGGQVIVRRLRDLPGDALPSAFFTSYGQDVGAMWQAFREFLTGYAEGRDEDDVIVQSACATFATIGDWLTGEC